MVDIQTLNTLLWAVITMSAVAVAIAASAITIEWLIQRRRHLRHVASGVYALEAHLTEAAKDRTAR